MKKWFWTWMPGVTAFLLIATTPASLLAAEYSLDDLCRIALSQSEKLKVAEENLNISEIGKEKALSYLLPRLTAGAGYNQYAERKVSGTSVIQAEHSATWSLRMDETVSLSGRELTGLDISRQNVAKSQHDLSAAREDYLIRYVAAPYYRVLMARKNLEIAEANLDRLERYRNAAEQRVKIGEVTRTVLLRAEGELSGARSDRLQAQNALELAMAILASNCGIKEAFTLIEFPMEDKQIPLLNTFQEQALTTRPDLKSLEMQRKIAANQTLYAEGAFWPNFSVYGVYAGADQVPPSGNLNRESIYAGATLQFPFFEGGLRKAEVKESKTRERQTSLVYDDLKKTIEIEVQTAYLELITQKGTLQFLNDQMVFARDNIRAVARQFEFGLSNSLDVLDANNLLVSSERKVATALYTYQLAQLYMKKATGTLLATVGLQ